MKRRNFLAGAGLGAFAAALPARGAVPPGTATDTRFNVRDFGATGDGRTSDTAAIQKALETAGGVGGTVWFPAGVYRCHGLRVPPHVTLLADPVWIFQGAKAGAVLELDDPSASCLLDITGAFGVHVHGLVLNGLRETPQPVHGIYLNNEEKWSRKEDSFVFDDIKVMNFSGHGIYLKRIWLFIIRHSQCYHNKGDGVRINGWDGFVTDNQFSGNGGNGFGCEGAGATVMFTANRVEWNHGYGLLLGGGDDWNVTGNSFDRNWGAGLCAIGTRAVTVTGNVFRRCGKDSNLLAEGEKSCQVRLEGCRGLTMVGNTCLAGRDDGGKGLYTPQVGFILKNLAYSVVKDNALYHGYMQDMVVDLGGHGDGYVFKDNVGCPMK
ncbi:MAG: right-handed parallel beta-helix repeat-containing protein [Kiritimatiellia bacterium]